MTAPNETHELFDKVGEDPTLDKFFDDNPTNVNMADVVRFFRAKRAQFIDGKGKGRGKTPEAEEESSNDD